MNIKPEELIANGYTELESLEHKAMVPFIRKYLNKRTGFSRFYYLSNILLLGFSIYLFLKDFNTVEYDFVTRFNYFSIGIALAFALIPIHEFIHVLAYRSQGAKQTSYAVNLKKFYFMALADKFVANKKEFQIVALAPFVVISTFLLMPIPFVEMNGLLTLVGILLAHTAMCSGDFGLLSYFAYNKKSVVVTFDDTTNGMSYFYGKSAEKIE